MRCPEYPASAERSNHPRPVLRARTISGLARSAGPRDRGHSAGIRPSPRGGDRDSLRLPGSGPAPPRFRVTSGVQELAQEKLTPLLRLRYQNSIADAVADLGKPEDIGQLFSGFQRYLYEPAA
jgi:hypothetical protein